jgi:hypothetical protein
MPDSQQPPIIKSGPKKVGRSFGSVPSNKLPSQLPEMVGKRFGRLKVISATVDRSKGRAYMMTECSTCSTHLFKDYSSLVRRLAGCRSCGQPRRVPKWLYSRCSSAKDRCTNPNNKCYDDYGGLWIEFRFMSPLAMALWVQEHLGLHRELEIDRIEYDGHYVSGNLQYMTGSQNVSHTRRPQLNALLHRFRLKHPNIRYADSTLRTLLGRNLTFEQIIERFHTRSDKPKGVYGTFSTPDPTIASLLKDS